MEKALELLVTGMILNRSREMRNAYQEASDAALIDKAVKEFADHHTLIMEKLKTAMP